MSRPGWQDRVFRGPAYRERYPEHAADIEMGIVAEGGTVVESEGSSGLNTTQRPLLSTTQTSARAAQGLKPREFKVETVDSGQALLRKIGLVRQEGIFKKGMCNSVDVFCDVHRSDEYGESDPVWCAVSRPGVPVIAAAQERSVQQEAEGQSPRSSKTAREKRERAEKHRQAKERVTKRREAAMPAFVCVMGHIDFSRMQFLDEGTKKKGASVNTADGDLIRYLKRKKAQKKNTVAKDGGKDDGEGSDDEEEIIQKKKNIGQDGLIGDTEFYDEKRKRVIDRNKHSLGMDTKDDEHDELYNIINTGNEDGSLLTSGEVAKVIRQYITRSIVAAVRLKGCAIVTTDTGDIKNALAKGVQAAGIATPGDYPEGITIGGRIPVVDVQPSYTPPGSLSPWFSHRVVVSPPGPEYDDPDDNTDEKQGLLDSAANDTAQGVGPTVASAKDITDTVVKLLEAASQGSDGLVKRNPSRIVGVVIGGHAKSTRFELIPFIQNRWPFLIIEGSGGYADMLASVINRIETISGGHASKDDYQSLLSNYDASTAQVIYEGNWVLIRKGTVPEVMTRILLQAISGNEILTRAWESYAAWNALALNNESCYGQLMLWILVLGVLATAISILQTFLQLTFENETDGKDSNGTRKWAGGSGSVSAQIHSVLSIVVVVLPITISLLQSITNRINAGAKWVSLKSCAECLLSEIYMYRTQSGAYAEQEIKKAYDKRVKSNKEGRGGEGGGGGGGGGDAEDDGSAPADLPLYATRSELLHVKLTQYTQELVMSEMSENNIPKYHGPVPPKEVTQYGDDGYSDLSVESYARLRLQPKIDAYNRDAARYDKDKSRITLLIYGAGALGTALAALATFEVLRAYNIGAWVAFTTSVGSALTRYLDYTKSEWLHNKYTTVMHELQAVESWWTSRGSDSAKSSTMDTMVMSCEDKITDEISEFKQQLKIAVAESAKEAERLAEEREQIQDAMKRGDQPDLVKKMENLGLSRINSETIMGALKDPTSSEARKLIKALERIDDEFGGVIEEVKAQAEQTTLGKIVSTHIQNIDEYRQYMDDAGNIVAQVTSGDIHGAVTSAASELRLNPLNLEKLIPHDLMETIKDVTKRKLFLGHVEAMSRICDPWQMSYADVLTTAKKCGRQFQSQLADLPYRVAMEGLGKLCMQDVLTEFEDALEKLGLSPLDFVESREQIDLFISEVKKLSSLPQDTSIDALRAACAVPSMRKHLEDLSEAKVRSILKRGSKHFIESSPASEMHKAILEMTADMDLDVAFNCSDDQEPLINTLCNVHSLTAEIPAHFLEKDEIISVFPPAIAEQLAEKSQVTLTALLLRLQKGTVGKKHMDTWVRAPVDPVAAAKEATGGLEPDLEPHGRRPSVANGGKISGGLGGKPTRLSPFPKLEVMMHSFKNRQKLALAAESLDQIEINTYSKSTLLKKLRNIIGADPALNQELLLCNDLGIRMVLSGVRAAVSNSYPGRIFDMLTDELVSFDAGKMFTWDDREKLIQRMKDFKGINVNKKKDAWIRSMLGYKSLIDRCQCLDPQQLKELIMRLQNLMASTFGRRVFDRAIEHLDSVQNDTYKEAGFVSWRDQMVDRFVSTCVNIPDEILKGKFESDCVFREGLNLDEQLSRLTANLSWEELRDVIVQIKELSGERVVANVFEAASKEIGSEEVYHIFDSAFMLPPVRQRLIVCMTNLLFQVKGNAKKTLHLSDIAAESPDKILDRLREGVTLPSKQMEGDCTMMDPGVAVSAELQKDITESCTYRMNCDLIDALVKVFRGKARLSEVVEFLLAELKLTAGYRLFLRLCVEVHTFCVREIVKTPRARQGLFAVYLKMVWFNRLGFKPAEAGRPRREYQLAQVIITSCGGTGCDKDLVAVAPTKANLMTLVEEFCEDSYEGVEDALVHLTEAQLLDMTGAFYKVLTTTHVGVFFQMLERSVILGATRRANRLYTTVSEKRQKILKEERQKRARNEAILSIKCNLRLSATRVFDSFDGFDVRLFTARSAADKHEILSRFVQSNDVIESIVAYNESEVKSLFSYIKSNPAFRTFSDPENSDDEKEPTSPSSVVSSGSSGDPCIPLASAFEMDETMGRRTPPPKKLSVTGDRQRRPSQDGAPLPGRRTSTFASGAKLSPHARASPQRRATPPSDHPLLPGEVSPTAQAEGAGNAPSQQDPDPPAPETPPGVTEAASAAPQDDEAPPSAEGALGGAGSISGDAGSQGPPGEGEDGK